MQKDNFPYIAELTKLQSQIVRTIYKQIETLVKLERDRILAQDPERKFNWDDLEIYAANFKYRIVDGILQIKAPEWINWEEINSLHCNLIYPLAQDVDVFLPHAIKRVTEMD